MGYRSYAIGRSRISAAKTLDGRCLRRPGKDYDVRLFSEAKIGNIFLNPCAAARRLYVVGEPLVGRQSSLSANAARPP
ncbi:MAG: hypothetical protein JO170_20880 [Verrucomicrobia bacterium]|nr:hypothetical protein [Verrucomicrobiota bacterium]